MAETKKKLRIGIIGTGGIAHAHARAYQNFDDVEVVAGADIIDIQLPGAGGVGAAVEDPGEDFVGQSAAVGDKISCVAAHAVVKQVKYSVGV